jgi:3-oxoadipate enol-lactonase
MKTLMNGCELAFDLAGRGESLVFLHGFPFNRSTWDDQVGLFSPQFRTIRYDHRGQGESGVGDGLFTVELLVDDLIGMLDHLQVGRAILCGLSMGGYVALRAVERHPERVSGLVLCDTRSEADSNEAKMKRAAAIKAIAEKGVEAFADGFLKGIFPAETFEKRPDVVARVKKMITATSPLGLRGTLLALAARTSTTESLGRIQVPALVLVGEKDSITPPSAAESLQKAIPGATMRVIPGAGHLSNLDNPAAFNDALASFLKKSF